MNDQQLTARLEEVIGALSPAPGTAADAIDRVRELLSLAIRSGQSEPFTVDLVTSAPTEGHARPAAASGELPFGASFDPSTSNALSLRVYRRSWPVVTERVPTSVPPWARGWSPLESIGPFETDEGRHVWFDVRRTGAEVAILDAQTGRLLCLVPRSMSLRAPETFELPGGSIWLSATAFDPTVEAGSLVGLRIRGGTLSFDRPESIDHGVIAVRRGTVVSLYLQLEAPPLESGGRETPLDVDPVTEVTFVFDGGGARLAQTSSASVGLGGDRVRLTHRDGARAHYAPQLARLWFPMSVDRRNLALRESPSRVLSLSGAAAIDEAGWTVPVLAPTALGAREASWMPGAAADDGALVLSCSGGLEASLPFATAKLELESTLLLLAKRSVGVIATTAPMSLRRVLELWERRAGHRSKIELRSAEPLRLSFDASSRDGDTEALSIGPFECRTDLEQPVAASGDQVSFFSTRAALDVVRFDSNLRVYLSAPGEPPRYPIRGERIPGRPISIALSNAIASTSAALTLRVAGILEDALRVARGVLKLEFAVRFLLPSLPDPYAANLPRRAPRGLLAHTGADRGRLVAFVRWAEGASDLSFVLATGTTVDLAAGLVALEKAPLRSRARKERDYVGEVEDLFTRSTGRGRDLLRLLDVSSNAALFGVGVSGERAFKGVQASTLHLRGLDLIAPMGNVSAFTLPAFQWEPVYDIPIDGAPPFPSELVSPTDGGATRFAIPSATLVPVAPLPVIERLLEEYRQHEGELGVRFTLPFGIVAVAQLRRPSDTPDAGLLAPVFTKVQPSFTQQGLSGGVQLTLAVGLLARRLSGPSPGLPGAAAQADNGSNGFNVLKSGHVDEIFNATFADAMKMVPVKRIDFTGHGASIFSDWRHEDAKGAAVAQVKLEAVVGRTAREVVQIRSTLYPWGAKVVRTITMERTGGGGVFRRDSGWQAASDARYELAGCVVHPGVVSRLTNIRRIRDTTNVFDGSSAGGGASLAQVVFDADVEIEGVTLGANDVKLVPTHDLVGYVQLLPIGTDLTAKQLDELLLATGPVGGPIDCELDVGQSGMHMRLSRIEVDRTLSIAEDPQVVVVARGTLDVARGGQWTFAYRGDGEQELRRLATSQPIPLVRANPSPGFETPYRIADASELHRTAHP